MITLQTSEYLFPEEEIEIVHPIESNYTDIMKTEIVLSDTYIYKAGIYISYIIQYKISFCCRYVFTKFFKLAYDTSVEILLDKLFHMFIL